MVPLNKVLRTVLKSLAVVLNLDGMQSFTFSPASSRGFPHTVRNHKGRRAAFFLHCTTLSPTNTQNELLDLLEAHIPGLAAYQPTKQNFVMFSMGIRHGLTVCQKSSG